MLCLAPQLEQQASSWVLGDGGTRAVTEDGPGGVTGMARVGSPKNAALEGVHSGEAHRADVLTPGLCEEHTQGAAAIALQLATSAVLDPRSWVPSEVV